MEELLTTFVYALEELRQPMDESGI